MLVGSHLLDTATGSEQVYNTLDCCLTHEIFTTLSAQMPAAQPAYNFELAQQAPVLEMMLRGFAVNPGARELGINSTKEQLARLDVIIDGLAHAVWDKGLNPNSGMQLKELFYGRLGIPEIRVYSKGELKYPMDRGVIEQVEDYFQARPIAACVLAHRDLSKQLSVLETEVDADWRMRTSYNIGGTKSARFSSSSSPTGTGTNLQNISESLRHILVADPGYRLYGMDASQSDSRMVGYMCGLLFDDWTYLDACESGDLHTAVARLTWPKLAWTGDIKKDRKLAETPFYRHFSYRDCCKKLGHGTNFLGKAPTLAKLIHIPKDLVEPFQERYFDAFVALQKWHAWTASELQTKRRLISIHGRHRDFFDRTNADETVRKGLAFLAAAPTADNLNLGMWRIWRYMPHVQLLAQVHDAVYFQAPEELEPNTVVLEAQKHLAVTLTAPNGRKFTVPTDAKIGYNWGNRSPADEENNIAEKNPRGLWKFVAKA
jgi:DNA polymerase I-like protein with 3'-5' exonuclease and polymerase domains